MTSPMKEAALGYGELGLRIFPLVWYGYATDVPSDPRGADRIVGTPLVKWKEAATSDRHQIAKWWSKWPKAGIGLATGDDVGDEDFLFVIDLDRHDPNADGVDAWLDLVVQHDYEGFEGPRVLTGGGGEHLYFTAGTQITNARGSLPAGIDVRGSGGYVVLPPSSHKTGRSHEWEIDAELGEIPVPTAPKWLVDVLTTDPDRPEPSENSKSSPDPYADVWKELDDRPGTDWADRTSWSALLEADGWSFYGNGSDGEELWTRPGKEPREGWSATVNYGGADRLVVHSTTANVPADSYSKLGYLAFAHFGGDFTAATRSIAPEKPSQPSPDVDRVTGEPLPAHEVDENGELDEEDDWKPVDIAEIARQIARGEFEPELPDLLAVDGTDLGLLYPGRTHVIFGPPGGGKTWVALAAVAERLKRGEWVLFVDFEDSAHGTAMRLVRLGVTIEELERFDYRSVATSLAYGWTTLELSDRPYSLAVIDSTGEALAAQGVNPNDDGEVAGWMALVKKLTLRESAPAVLLLDHVPKSTENPHGAPIGSQRKLAAVSGAAYRCDTKTEPAKGTPGLLKLTTTKDRLGHRAKGRAAALVEIEDVLGGDWDRIEVRLRIETPDDRGIEAVPNEVVVMLRISEFLADSPGNTSPNAVIKAVTGSTQTIRDGIDALVDLGYVRRDPAPGRRGDVLNLLRPYYGDDDEGESSLSSPSLSRKTEEDSTNTDRESFLSSSPLEGEEEKDPEGPPSRSALL